jgi:hypothetical protein
MVSLRSGFNKLFILGAAAVVVFGLLAAVVPALAFVTVTSYFLDTPASGYNLPYVTYYALSFATHAATVNFALCVLGGIVGLFSLYKPVRPYGVFTSVVFITLGLLLPIDRVIVAIPEVRIFDTPWIGSYLILIGLLAMYLGVAEKRTRTGRITLLLTVPLLLGLYAIYPLFVATNFLPWLVFGTQGIIYYCILSLTVACHLLIIVGTIRAIRPELKKPESKKERENKV